jgi:hypothetical protein
MPDALAFATTAFRKFENAALRTGGALSVSSLNTFATLVQSPSNSIEKDRLETMRSASVRGILPIVDTTATRRAAENELGLSVRANVARDSPVAPSDILTKNTFAEATPDVEAISDLSAVKTVRSVNIVMLEAAVEFGGTANAKLKAATTTGAAIEAGAAADAAGRVRPTAKPTTRATIQVERMITAK